ncbi:amidase [Ponticaulis profundi]|uniref:Amidase n=1 Tax=Ponticaulis profundi TaxID=2665222 RepID=A0ABW1S6N6_9PROT
MKISRRNTLRSAGALAAFLPLASACATGQSRTADPTSGDFVDGVRTAEMIANGDVSATEVVNAAIDRTEQVNPQLNALAFKAFDQARERAAAGVDGRLAGVPTFIKDLNNWNGMETKYGSRAFVGYMPEKDDPISAAWRKAGLIPLGKTTSPEIGLTATTEPLVTGASRNPWNIDYSTGGSSGGAGAMVAARVVPFAHASDGGGSIRIPASCNGVFGLKPSRGRLYHQPSAPPVEISVSHAETISVRDSVAVFRINQTTDYADIGAISGPSTKRLKVGVALSTPTGVPIDPEVLAATEATAELCRELGHEVFEYKFDFSGAEFIDKFTLYWAAGAAEFVQQASAFAGKTPGPDLVEGLTLYLAGRAQQREAEVPEAIAYLKGFEALYDSWFENMDVLLSPTLPRLPFAIGEIGPDVPPDEHFAKVSDYAALTPLMNVSGAASMSVPLAWSQSGLPIGMMFSGKRGDDGMLFELAYELEAARPWAGKVPPVHA